MAYDAPMTMPSGTLCSAMAQAMRHLAVSGDDLLALGYRGPELGEMMRFLLDYVMEHPENNRPELLLGLAKDSEES